jgi:HEAT repeat protein
MSRKNWTSYKIFERLLTNKSKKTYWDNVRELRKRPNNDVHSRAINLLNSSSEKEIIIGIDVLAQLGFNPRFKQKETIQAYYELLEKPQSPNVLFSLFFGISHNNEILTDLQIVRILEYKNHKHVDVRYALVQAISCLEHEEAIKATIELSSDKYSHIRDWATFNLGSQLELSNKEIKNALWERIDDKFEKVRMEAIAGLAKRKDKKIKKILIEELTKIDDHGSTILEAIEAFEDPDFIELIEKQIKTNRKTKAVSEQWLRNTIEKLKTKTQQML